MTLIISWSARFENEVPFLTGVTTGIQSRQGWTATTKHEVTRKKKKQRWMVAY